MRFSCPRMRPGILMSPRLMRRKPPKRSPRGKEDARGAVCYTSQLRIGEWGIVSCPEERTAPSREGSAVDKLVKSMKKDLSIESTTKISKDRKLWSSNRPSLRCRPLSGGVAIKKVSKSMCLFHMCSKEPTAEKRRL